jgi:diguanylate cyclase (GGDEF)-like protein
VCEAAVLGGKFLGVAIAMADPDRTSLRFVAVDGPGEKTLHDASRTISLEGPGGNAMTARAFLSEQPFIINDYRNQAPQETIYGSTILKIGTRSTAAIPLISRGQPIGALVFLSAEPENFTLPFVELLQRLCRNVAFALENFDRATEKEQAEEKIKHLANHDGLTDLPNRTLFSQLLEFSIQSAKRYQRPCAVLFIDLDRFKLINDSLGHGAGDTLLIEMANRLREGVRASDVVARIGGDEFVVLLNEVNDAQHIKTVAASLLSSLGRSMELKGQECRVTASIGVAIYPDHGTDEQTLLKHADTAMYLAKTEGKNGVRLFSDYCSRRNSFQWPRIPTLFSQSAAGSSKPPVTRTWPGSARDFRRSPWPSMSRRGNSWMRICCASSTKHWPIAAWIQGSCKLKSPRAWSC